MNKFLLSAALCCVAGSAFAGSITLDKGASKSEQSAKNDFAKYFKAVTGKSIYGSDVPVNVYIGKAADKAQWYKRPADLKFEEWHIVSNGNDLVITGDLRGTVWGVYEFIEKYLGCRFLANDTEIIPKNPDWQLPKIDVRHKPAFIRREMSGGKPRLNTPTFRMKRKESTRTPSTELWVRFGSPHGCHTYGKYVAAIPQNVKFKRAKGNPNAPCYSDPAARKAFADQLKRFIEADRKGVDKSQWRILYSVDQNDGFGNNCKCSDCAKFPSVSDANIDFTNAIAEMIEKDYPEVLVQTFAYQHTQQPPKKIKARKNVIVRSCNSEIVAPLLPGTPQGDILAGWRNMAENLAIWAYWKPYAGEETPYIKPRKVMQQEIKFCRDNHVLTYYAENERPNLRNFWPLQYYLWSHLMIDPDCDIDKLSDEFFKGYYGKAAPYMEEYCQYLEKRMLALPYQVRGNVFGLLDAEFFATADRLLDAAEKAVAGDARSLKHVQWERIPVDHSRLLRMNKFPLGKDKDKVIKRWYDNSAMVLKTFMTDSQWRKEGLKAALENLKNDVRLFNAMPFSIPEQFKGKKIQDFHWPDFDPWGAHARYVVDDPEAASTRTFGFDKRKKNLEHTLPIHIGLYDSTAPKGKKLIANYEWNKGDYATDEKYHWVKLGTTVITQNLRIYWHKRWASRIYMRKGIIGIDQNFPKEIWASIKITGPAYVDGSTKPNGVFIERVILVEKGGK